jgi:hypothetical protein
VGNQSDDSVETIAEVGGEKCLLTGLYALRQVGLSQIAFVREPNRGRETMVCAHVLGSLWFNAESEIKTGELEKREYSTGKLHQNPATRTTCMVCSWQGVLCGGSMVDAE